MGTTRRQPALSFRGHGAAFLAVLACVLAASTTPASAKRKDDRLVVANGDHFVGEIKRLEHGELHFKTDYVVDEFVLDWAKVQDLDSQDTFQVALKDGRHLTGVIARQAGRVTITAAGAAGGTSASWLDVVGFLPVETSVWRQLTGNITSGFSYTSDDNQTQFSASGALGYVAERWSVDATGSATLSAQTDASHTRRTTAELTNRIAIAPQWFAAGVLGLLSSHQQDLDLRTTVGAGIGRWLIRTERTGLAAFGGLVYTREHYFGQTDSTRLAPPPANNVEGIASLRFSLYRFKTVDVETNASVYPSVTSAGRVRLTLAPTLNIEIVHNLYWSFTLYENYDSRPPVNANRNDFGVTNSIGWKF